MNCHHARQLISPYLDQQLTGRQMLALQEHFGHCPACEGEMRSIRQVKTLLRGLHDPSPRRDLSQAIALRLSASEAELPGWRVLNLPALPVASSPLVLGRPQRGRRLAAALVLSCVTVFSFAAPFAPAARDGAPSSSGLVSSSFWGPSASLTDPVSLPKGAALSQWTSLEPSPQLTLADQTSYMTLTAVPLGAVSTVPHEAFSTLAAPETSEHERLLLLTSMPVLPEAQYRSQIYLSEQHLRLHR